MPIIEPDEMNVIVYAVPFCPQVVDGSVQKNCIAKIMLKLTEKVCDGHLMQGERIGILFVAPYAPKGDVKVFDEEIARYVSIYEATNDAECDACVDKLMKRLEGKDAMGVDVLDRYLDRLGMQRYGAERFTVKLKVSQED